MHRKKSLPRRIAGYLLWLVAIILILFALQITVLAFPQILLHNRAEAGTVVLYYDGDRIPEIDALAAGINGRLQGNRFYDSTRTDHVYLFRDQGLYEKIVRLTFQPVVPQGFNLSILGNTYLCEPIIDMLGRSTGGQPKFSIWEGNIAHTAAHEVGHQYIADRIGRGGLKQLRHWKQEGLPEYIANQGTAHEDSTATLVNRIGVFLDDGNWTAAPPGRRPGWDRIHYKAWLMVEYLFEVEGLSLEQLIADDVTEADVYSRLMEWYRGQIAPPDII